MNGTIGNLKLFRKEEVTLRKFNCIQEISFGFGRDGITAGTWTIKYGLLETASIDHAAVADDIADALNDLTGLSAVIVTGDYNFGFVIEFAGADGNKDHPNLKVGTNNLESGLGTGAVTIVIETLNRGYDSLGNYVLTDGLDTVIDACVQPLTGRQIDQLPNYDATREVLKIYTKTELRKEYTVVRNAIEYEVNNVETWYGYYKALLIEKKPEVSTS